MTFPNTPFESEDDEESESPSGGGSRIAIWLVILGLALIFIPLYLTSNTIQEGAVQLNDQLTEVAATLAFTPPPNPTLEHLNATLAVVRQQSSLMNSLQSTLVALHVDWPVIMAHLGTYNSARMSITGISQNGQTILVQGLADDENVVTTYAEMLRTSGLFKQVVVESINIQNLPTPTPTRTPLPESTAEATTEPDTAPRRTTVANFQVTITLLENRT